MITHLKIDLTEEQLAALGVRLNGKKSKATRAQVTDFTLKLVRDALADRVGSTELRNFICPKCSKPIALSVPKVQPKIEQTSVSASPPVETPAVKVTLKAKPDLHPGTKELVDITTAAALALTKFAEALNRD